MEICCWICGFNIGVIKLRIMVYALNTKLCDFYRAIEMVDYSGCLRGNDARSLNLSSLWVESLDGFQPDSCIAITLDNPSKKIIIRHLHMLWFGQRIHSIVLASHYGCIC